MNLNSILSAFLPEATTCEIEPLGTGLINSTWKVKSQVKQEEFVLQKINKTVFKKPEDIAENIDLLNDYFKENYPDYLFTHSAKALQTGLGYTVFDEDYYRMFSFVKNSKTLTTLQKPEQAYEASLQFGKFTSLLAGIDASKLKVTIPDFHNLTLRYQQFEDALINGNQQRKLASAEAIDFLKANYEIVEIYENIKQNPQFKLRVTHHDTKISNVLFDSTDKGMCVIDLDTVMPGYFISDVGDMFRTYLCPVSEEETDLSKFEVRPSFFEAITKGYLSQMKNELTEDELNHFFYAGEFMIYMQAIRFLTDYLNDDIYYGAKYPNHNFNRACNQIQLLKYYKKHKSVFENIVCKNK